MGELVISIEELEIEKEEEQEEQQQKGTGMKRNGLVVKWEKLLPRMVLRVLLVEADDSTRQIIAALLRKCSYKVVAVPDGLKAWEMLKGRPHDIDLILTEVDLPSITGYALLTLIMEHDICKKIPVIMMSSQDSISTVYKCMLRGAADYLVKPIRRNELRNLWQHVWRRQSSLSGGNGFQDESVGQDKVEATSENNPASNHSSGDMDCVQNSKEFAAKGSDTQSSCTKPDAEAESACIENTRDFFQPLWGKFYPSGMSMQNHEASMDFAQKLVMLENIAGGSAVAACKNYNEMTVHEDVEPENQRTIANITHEACYSNHVVNSSLEAIDFMGTSASQNSSSDNVKSKFDFSPHLDLCLTRCYPSGFEVRGAENRHTLWHSNSSAFTRYTNRPSQHLNSTLAGVQKESDSERKLFSNIGGYNADAPGLAPSTETSTISVVNGETKESEIAYPQKRVFPLQIPVNGISFNDLLCPSHSSVFPPMFFKQSGPSQIPSPRSGSQPEPNCNVNSILQSNFKSGSDHNYDQFGQTANEFSNPPLQKHKLDSLEGQAQISPATDQSATSSFHNGAASYLNMGYGSTSGSNSNIDQVAVVKDAAERQTEEGVIQNANSHRSIQREVALTKFRLKRKDRCFEKKVRYESRKKLAELRPRVKGQFVRQVNPLYPETQQ